MDDLAAILRTLGDPTRLRIFDILRGGELCVCEIVERLGISQPLASHHLRELKRAGLVLDRRQGVWTHNRLDEGAVASLRERIEALLEPAAATGGGDKSCCGPRGRAV